MDSQRMGRGLAWIMLSAYLVSALVSVWAISSLWSHLRSALHEDAPTEQPLSSRFGSTDVAPAEKAKRSYGIYLDESLIAILALWAMARRASPPS